MRSSKNCKPPLTPAMLLVSTIDSRKMCSEAVLLWPLLLDMIKFTPFTLECLDAMANGGSQRRSMSQIDATSTPSGEFCLSPNVSANHLVERLLNLVTGLQILATISSLIEPLACQIFCIFLPGFKRRHQPNPSCELGLGFWVLSYSGSSGHRHQFGLAGLGSLESMSLCISGLSHFSKRQWNGSSTYL